MSNGVTQNIILVSFIENQQNINDHIFSSHPIHIQQMCVSIRYLNGYSKSLPEKKTVYIYERRVCDGKNYRNSNSGFSIGFFLGKWRVYWTSPLNVFLCKEAFGSTTTTYRQQLVAMVVQELCCYYSSLSSSIHWRNFFLLVKMSIVDSELKKKFILICCWILPFSSNSVQVSIAQTQPSRRKIQFMMYLTSL